MASHDRGPARDGRRHSSFSTTHTAHLPVSWQDTGSGVFALVVAAVALGLGPLRSKPAYRSVSYALLARLAALLVDVYLY